MFSARVRLKYLTLMSFKLSKDLVYCYIVNTDDRAPAFVVEKITSRSLHKIMEMFKF